MIVVAALSVPLFVFHVTVVRGTALPSVSTTFAVSGSGSLAPTWIPACASPETTRMFAGGLAGGGVLRVDKAGKDHENNRCANERREV